MKKYSNRISQDGLADAVSMAIALEHARIEQLDAEMLAHVSGGEASITGIPGIPVIGGGGGGTTMGLIDTTPPSQN